MGDKHQQSNSVDNAVVCEYRSVSGWTQFFSSNMFEAAVVRPVEKNAILPTRLHLVTLDFHQKT